MNRRNHAPYVLNSKSNKKKKAGMSCACHRAAHPAAERNVPFLLFMLLSSVAEEKEAHTEWFICRGSSASDGKRSCTVKAATLALFFGRHKRREQEMDGLLTVERAKKLSIPLGSARQFYEYSRSLFYSTKIAQIEQVNGVLCNKSSAIFSLLLAVFLFIKAYSTDSTFLLFVVPHLEDP